MTLRATGRDAEAGDDLIKNKDTLMFCRQFAEGTQKLAANGNLPKMPPSRFQNDAADAEIGRKRPFHRSGIVGWNHDCLSLDLGRDARDRPAVVGGIGGRDDSIMPAVKMSCELQHARLACEQPSEA